MNNAAYWVRQTSEGENRILLDAVDDRVIVADDGPGVEEDDLKQLFTLFFTRKVRGSRGRPLSVPRQSRRGRSRHRIYDRRAPKTPAGSQFRLRFQGNTL